MMSQTLPDTKGGWIYEIGTKLGVPALVLVGLWYSFDKAWDTMVIPLANRAISRMDTAEEATKAQTEMVKAQTAILTAIKADAAETMAWTRTRAAADREQLEILKRIEQRGMN